VTHLDALCQDPDLRDPDLFCAYRRLVRHWRWLSAWQGALDRAWHPSADQAWTGSVRRSTESRSSMSGASPEPRLV
jgi:hypothetical protein